MMEMVLNPGLSDSIWHLNSPFSSTKITVIVIITLVYISHPGIQEYALKTI